MVLVHWYDKRKQYKNMAVQSNTFIANTNFSFFLKNNILFKQEFSSETIENSIFALQLLFSV